MDKAKLKKQLDELKRQIVDGAKNTVTAARQLDELLSVKGQLDVEETCLVVPMKDVIKEYDMDEFRIVRCKSCFIWWFKGGMYVVIRPTMKAVYEQVKELCALKDDYDNLDDLDKSCYDGLLFGLQMIFSLPMWAVVDDEFFANMVNNIIKGLEKVQKKFDKLGLLDETPEEDAKTEIMDNAVKILVGDRNKDA